jgi:FtsZ-interacting cell division protein ZipA
MLEFIILCVIVVVGWFFWKKKRARKHNRATPSVAGRQEPIINDDVPIPVIKRTAPDQAELNLDPLDMPIESEEEQRISAELDAALGALQTEVKDEVAALDIELDALHADAAELDAELVTLKSDVTSFNAELNSLETASHPPLKTNQFPPVVKAESTEETAINETNPDPDSEKAAGSKGEADIMMIAFAVMSQVGRTLSGEAVLNLFSDLDLTFAEGAGFYLKADAGDMENPLFTVANMVTPGTFDPTIFVAETTPGLLLFTRLENDNTAWEKFSAIAETAEELAEQLDGVLCDEQNKAISASRMVEIQNEVAAFVANHG